jgi:predicted transcriptional regulator
MPKSTPVNAGSSPLATDITAPLIIDLLEWLAAESRPYAEVMDGWRTSCPRLTIWEDAVDGGYVVRRREGRREAVVEVTPLGHRLLDEARRRPG